MLRNGVEPFSIRNEYDRLTHVIMGTAAGYHRNSEYVSVVNRTQQRTVDAEGHPTECQLLPEFSEFRSALENAGVSVHEPALAPETVQDQTCPRDIGFVIGDVLVIAGMRHESRTEEWQGIRHILEKHSNRVIEVPTGIALEGGDVVVHGDEVFVGWGQRSDFAGVEFLDEHFGEDFNIVPMPCRFAEGEEDVSHLDCVFNPLGRGHALIYPQGLMAVPPVLRDQFDLIEVDRSEAYALATNVLSIAPDTVVARSGPPCARVNQRLREAGYTVIEVQFDGVPSTGGSFRCATLPLQRQACG